MSVPREIKLYRARTILPMASQPIEDGALAVLGSEIIAVGRWSDLLAEHSTSLREDLGDVILMPGLINAHCHLDYTMMRGALFGGSSFSGWIQRLNAVRHSLETRDYLDSIGEGLQELRRWGCTTVLNIESFPELVPLLPESPIRVWWFLEVMDIRTRLQSSEALAGAIQFFEEASKAAKESGGFGISPHAPYTVSRALYELSSLYARQYHLPLCTHLAESDEEMEMFSSGEGALYDFLRSIGRSMDDCRGTTPVQAVLGGGLVPEGTILVHMNHLSEADRQLMGKMSGSYPVVHCPRTHAFFDRPPFDLQFFRHNNIPLLLGTDSLASNQDLNMFAEMRSMAKAFPELEPAEIVKMVTTAPATALGRSGRLGELSRGALADFIAFPDPAPTHGSRDIEERVLANRTLPTVWISGQT
jgi:cytosine/adenosine deaminase-related metal-dependent hydrolase